ncbi:MAG TPA: hypothetical protein VHS28_04275 [Chloroflexota bacterium]|nr:hypothetical protein [Chloroflexota bacterium]
MNERSSIIVVVDEAHCTQEDDLGRKMREALPNAFLFDLTGTPINRAHRNTIRALGPMKTIRAARVTTRSKNSIQDRATLPLHFEAPEIKLKINRVAIDEAYRTITDMLSEQDRDDLANKETKITVLVKNPERVQVPDSLLIYERARKAVSTQEKRRRLTTKGGN